MVIATNLEAPRVIKRYSVADGEAIPKGTLLKLSGADLYATASTAVAAGEIFAGIATEEKTADDGVTEIAAAIDGVWDIGNGPDAITLGNMVSLSGANLIRSAVEADFPLGLVLGKALETGGASETIRVRLGLN